MLLIYPNEEDLQKYRDILLRLNFPYLPPMDDRWVLDMHAMFALVQMLPDCADNFFNAAANLFFKVTKNHQRFDGNKRSAICCLVFFIILNKMQNDITNQEIEELALEVAASKGNTGDQLIPQLRHFFERKIIPMQNL